MAVALEVLHRAARLVDRDLVEVRAAQPLQLGVEIGEVTALQQRIVGEVDARHDVCGAERHLLGLREDVGGVGVQHHPPDDPQGEHLLRDVFRGVEHVEVPLARKVLVEQLDRQLPLREFLLLDVGPKVAAVEVGVGAVDLDRLIPHHGLQPHLRPPVELDVGALASLVDEPERMDAKALHGPIAARDRAIGHDPHDHVHRLRRQGREVPEGVVRRLRLREAAIRLLLHRVDDVGKLDGVLNEEHRDVVADEIPYAFASIELHSKTPHVARQVERAAIAGDGAEPDEDRCPDADLAEHLGARERCEAAGQLKVAVSARAPRVNDPLGYPLVIEVGDLLAIDEILEQGRTPRAGA